MDLIDYNVDEYQPLKLGNKFAPIWPFRMVVSGSSDSGKTTMIINLLMGNKKVKEDGERYILCNDVVLIGKHLDEPKWKIVEDFYNELSLSEDVSFKSFSSEQMPDISDFDPSRYTVVIFEDLINEPKKIQEQIASYFTHGRHRNISSIYVSQRFFSIPKTIRENITYISLHRGSGSLSDIKRIISQYTEHSDTIAAIIDDFTLKKEFIVFDLRKSKDDPLSIRVRWDTTLRYILDQTKSELRSNLDQSKSELRSVNVVDVSYNSSKFSNYGLNAIAEAKRNNILVDFSSKLPSPAERKLLLKENIFVKNSNIWAKYVFREAFGITSKELGPEWIKFSERLENKTSKDSQLLRYKSLLETKPLDDKKYIEGCSILLWLLENNYIDRKTFYIGIRDLNT